MVFYSVYIEKYKCVDSYYLNKENARDQLWELFLLESREVYNQKQLGCYRNFLDTCDYIPGFGCVNEESFGDEEDE